MADKNILIYTDLDSFIANEGDVIDNYINSMFGEFVVILGEDNKTVLTNEEGDAYMVMEYI